jgi:hypothetical protein
MRDPERTSQQQIESVIHSRISASQSKMAQRARDGVSNDGEGSTKSAPR